MNEQTTHNSELGLELFLLDAFRRGDMERLSALVPWDGAEENQIEDKYSCKTVVR